MLPDEPNDEERLEELPGDEGQTPFTPAGASRDDAAEPDSDRQVEELDEDDTEPVKDTDVDATEIYQQGQEQVGSNQGSDVVGYDPDSDQRRDA